MKTGSFYMIPGQVTIVRLSEDSTSRLLSSGDVVIKLGDYQLELDEEAAVVVRNRLNELIPEKKA